MIRYVLLTSDCTLPSRYADDAWTTNNYISFGTSFNWRGRDEIDAYNWKQFFQFRRMLQQHHDEKMLWHCVPVKHKYILLLTQSILCRWDR